MMQSVHVWRRLEDPEWPVSGRLGHGKAALVVVLVCLTTACRTVVDFAAIQDGQTAAQVKTALVNDPTLGTAIIEVSVNQGVAHLTGTVRSQAEAERAAAIARGVPGVMRVEAELRIDGSGAPPPDSVPVRPTEEIAEPPGDPRLLAVGLSLGWSEPRGGLRGAGMGVGPLIRLGSGQGFGPSLALGWYQFSLPPAAGDFGIRSRVRVRPLMAGVGYTFASDRVSFAPSIVAGWAFNDLSVPSTTGRVGRLAVGADNSFVWRPGVSLWVEAGRRFAVNASGGYAITRIRMTFLEDGQLVRSHLRADTTILHLGLAYKLF